MKKKKTKPVKEKKIVKPSIDRIWLKEILDKRDIGVCEFAHEMYVTKQMGSDILSGKAIFPHKRWPMLADYLGFSDWKEMKFVTPRSEVEP